MICVKRIECLASHRPTPRLLICQQPSLLIPNNLPQRRRRTGRRGGRGGGGLLGQKEGEGQQGKNKLQRMSTGNWEKDPLFSIKASSVTKGDCLFPLLSSLIPLPVWALLPPPPHRLSFSLFLSTGWWKK